MAKSDFIQQLQALNYVAQEPATGFVAFEYEIPVGRFIGRKVLMAFQINDNFPMDAPGGPHINPHLLPINPSGLHPFGAIHQSPLGGEWEYWSRPFREWNATERSVKVYLGHVKNLFATIPPVS